MFIYLLAEAKTCTGKTVES